MYRTRLALRYGIMTSGVSSGVSRGGGGGGGRLGSLTTTGGVKGVGDDLRASVKTGVALTHAS